MSDLKVSWDEYNRKIEELAITVSDYEFNQIVCVAKGGLRVGDILSRIYNVPLAILSAESYDGKTQTQGELVFSRDLAMTRPGLGSKVLLVDDLADSGTTLIKTVEWLRHYYGFYIKEMKTAVLWTKGCSAFTPDYQCEYLADSPWIHQPFGKYEVMTIEDLKNNG
jgi:hypoxanthine phosphoribosyltransferase